MTQAYYKAFTNFKHMINRGVGLYSRGSFEKEHNLKWDPDGFYN
jgi:hypothetical protein